MVEAGKRGLEILATNFVDRLELLNVADIDIDPAYAFIVPPPVSTAAFRFSHTWRVCAVMSAIPVSCRRQDAPSSRK